MPMSSGQPCDFAGKADEEPARERSAKPRPSRGTTAKLAMGHHWRSLQPSALCDKTARRENRHGAGGPGDTLRVRPDLSAAMRVPTLLDVDEDAYL